MVATGVCCDTLIQLLEIASPSARCLGDWSSHRFCGKHAVAGRSISHSHRTVARTFKPNIQRVTVVVDGHKKKANVCTRCLKSGKIARS